MTFNSLLTPNKLKITQDIPAATPTNDPDLNSAMNVKSTEKIPSITVQVLNPYGIPVPGRGALDQIQINLPSPKTFASGSDVKTVNANAEVTFDDLAYSTPEKLLNMQVKGISDLSSVQTDTTGNFDIVVPAEKLAFVSTFDNSTPNIEAGDDITTTLNGGDLEVKVTDLLGNLASEAGGEVSIEINSVEVARSSVISGVASFNNVKLNYRKAGLAITAKYTDIAVPAITSTEKFNSIISADRLVWVRNILASGDVGFSDHNLNNAHDIEYDSDFEIELKVENRNFVPYPGDPTSEFLQVTLMQGGSPKAFTPAMASNQVGVKSDGSVIFSLRNEVVSDYLLSLKIDGVGALNSLTANSNEFDTDLTIGKVAFVTDFVSGEQVEAGDNINSAQLVYVKAFNGKNIGDPASSIILAVMRGDNTTIATDVLGSVTIRASAGTLGGTLSATKNGDGVFVFNNLEMRERQASTTLIGTYNSKDSDPSTAFESTLTLSKLTWDQNIPKAGDAAFKDTNTNSEHDYTISEKLDKIILNGLNTHDIPVPGTGEDFDITLSNADSLVGTTNQPLDANGKVTFDNLKYFKVASSLTVTVSDGSISSSASEVFESLLPAITWSLSSPAANAKSNDSTPVLAGSNLDAFNGGKAYQYKDASCSTLLATKAIVSNATSFNATSFQTDGSDDGNINFYVKLEDSSTNLSGCIDTKVGYTFDTQRPYNLNITDAPSTYSATVSSSLTWDAATDDLSGVSDYEMAVYKSSDNSLIKDFTSVGDVTTGELTSGFSLTLNESYYTKLRAIDQAGNVSSEVQSSDWYYLPDPSPVVLDNTNDTYVAPANGFIKIVTVGGGGGGADFYGNKCGSGGNAGNLVIEYVKVTAGEKFKVIEGAAGAKGVASNGDKGGDTSVYRESDNELLAIARGGHGGVAGAMPFYDLFSTGGQGGGPSTFNDIGRCGGGQGAIGYDGGAAGNASYDGNVHHYTARNGGQGGASIYGQGGAGGNGSIGASHSAWGPGGDGGNSIFGNGGNGGNGGDRSGWPNKAGNGGKGGSSFLANGGQGGIGGNHSTGADNGIGGDGGNTVYGAGGARGGSPTSGQGSKGTNLIERHGSMIGEDLSTVYDASKLPAYPAGGKGNGGNGAAYNTAPTDGTKGFVSIQFSNAFDYVKIRSPQMGSDLVQDGGTEESFSVSGECGKNGTSVSVSVSGTAAKSSSCTNNKFAVSGFNIRSFLDHSARGAIIATQGNTQDAIYIDPVHYSGSFAKQTFTAPSSGILKLVLIGGGGAGASNCGAGGDAGSIEVDYVKVSAGDQLEYYAGKGGTGGAATIASSGEGSFVADPVSKKVYASARGGNGGDFERYQVLRYSRGGQGGAGSRDKLAGCRGGDGANGYNGGTGADNSHADWGNDRADHAGDGGMSFFGIAGEGGVGGNSHWRPSGDGGNGGLGVFTLGGNGGDGGVSNWDPAGDGGRGGDSVLLKAGKGGKGGAGNWDPAGDGGDGGNSVMGAAGDAGDHGDNAGNSTDGSNGSPGNSLSALIGGDDLSAIVNLGLIEAYNPAIGFGGDAGSSGQNGVSGGDGSVDISYTTSSFVKVKNIGFGSKISLIGMRANAITLSGLCSDIGQTVAITVSGTNTVNANCEADATTGLGKFETGQIDASTYFAVTDHGIAAIEHAGAQDLLYFNF